jgi:chaperonin cofactor prefoldin
MMGSSGDKTLLMLGEAFFEESEDVATEFCEQLVETTQAKLSGLQEELQGIVEEQAGLKAKLYERFGKSINLEDS